MVAFATGAARADDRQSEIRTVRAFDFVCGGDASVTLAVTTVAQALTPTQSIPSIGCQALLTCTGTAPAFIRTDGTAATTATGWPILPNTQIIITLQPNAVFSVIAAAAATTTVFITLGFGQ